MQNPWVHDDVPETTSIHESRAKLIGTALWGLLVLAVGLFVVLSGSGIVDFGGTGSVSTALTIVLAAFALVLALPIILKVLAISRLLGTIAFLATSWLVGRFVGTREAERLGGIGEIETTRETISAAFEPLEELFELLDVVLALL